MRKTLHAPHPDTSSETYCGLHVELTGARIAHAGACVDCPRCVAKLATNPQWYNQLHAKGIAAEASPIEGTRLEQDDHWRQLRNHQAKRRRELARQQKRQELEEVLERAGRR